METPFIISHKDLPIKDEITNYKPVEIKLTERIVAVSGEAIPKDSIIKLIVSLEYAKEHHSRVIAPCEIRGNDTRMKRVIVRSTDLIDKGEVLSQFVNLVEVDFITGGEANFSLIKYQPWKAALHIMPHPDKKDLSKLIVSLSYESLFIISHSNTKEFLDLVEFNEIVARQRREEEARKLREEERKLREGWDAYTDEDKYKIREEKGYMYKNHCIFRATKDIDAWVFSGRTKQTRTEVKISKGTLLRMVDFSNELFIATEEYREYEDYRNQICREYIHSDLKMSDKDLLHNLEPTEIFKVAVSSYENIKSRKTGKKYKFYYNIGNEITYRLVPADQYVNRVHIELHNINENHTLSYSYVFMYKGEGSAYMPELPVLVLKSLYDANFKYYSVMVKEDEEAGYEAWEYDNDDNDWSHFDNDIPDADMWHDPTWFN